MLDDIRGKRILVVGSAGFIGYHVVSTLEGAGAKPIGMDVVGPRDGQGHLPWVTGSVSDPALFATAAAGCHGVVFLANSSLPGTANHDLAAEVEAHVQVTIKAAEICNDQGVKRFVFASSGGTVYGTDPDGPLLEDSPTSPRNAYGVSKLSIEHYLRLLGLMRSMSTVSLRVSNPYGEGQRALRNQGFIAAALQHVTEGTKMEIWGDGSVERDFIYVGDVARAFVLAMQVQTAPDAINIGSGEAVALRTILDELGRVIGRPVPVSYQDSRQIDVKRNVLSVQRAQDVLGWSPEVSLSDGLKRTAQWWNLI